MQSLSPPSSSHSLRFLIPTLPLVGKCSYTFGLTNQVGSSRVHWQSSCTILAGKVVSHQHSSHFNNCAAAVNAANSLSRTFPISTTRSFFRPNLSRFQTPHRLPCTAHCFVSLIRAFPESTPKLPPARPIPTAKPFLATNLRRLSRRWRFGSPIVLLVEHSLGGSFHRIYDLFLHHILHIVGEVQLPVHHCLLTLPGIQKEYLTCVTSHPQTLAQCELTLTKLGLNVTREAVDNTAGAAKFISTNNLRDTAVIASARAAKLYGLQVMADGIQDDPRNVTRFVMLAREPINSSLFKTSIVFAHDKGMSVPFKVLSALAFRNISLTKIESRPPRNRPIRLVDDTKVGSAMQFEYLYYVDFEASMAEVRAQNALAEVQEFTSFFRALGSYPVDMTPLNPSF